jgi:hypothetical protein
MRSRPYWPNQSIYFLTGTTYLHYPYFREFAQKQILLNQINKIIELLPLDKNQMVYSIAMNHYHLKCYLENGLLIAKIKQLLHGGTSFHYKNQYSMKYKDLWQGSHILRITSEEMDWKVTGYIIGNLLKHKEVNTLEELQNNPFSSYRTIVEKYGKEVAEQLIYRFIDVDEQNNGLIKLTNLNSIKLPSIQTFRPNFS